jgi:hypothetical protein
MDQSIIILIFEISACSSTGYKAVIILPWLWFGPSTSLQQPDGSLSPFSLARARSMPAHFAPVPFGCIRPPSGFWSMLYPLVYAWAGESLLFSAWPGCLPFPRADAPPPPNISLLFSFHCLIVGSLPQLGCASQNWYPLLFFPLAGAPGVNRLVLHLATWEFV